jgi:hypothetical protein
VVAGPQRPAAAAATADFDGWVLATTSPAAAAGAPAYIGNG